MESKTIIRLWAMTLVAVLLIVDALTWKIDHTLWSLGIAVISGLGGYEIGVYKSKKS